jgi:hypothetical protein
MAFLVIPGAVRELLVRRRVHAGVGGGIEHHLVKELRAAAIFRKQR